MNKLIYSKIADNAIVYLKKFILLNQEFISNGYDVKDGHELNLISLEDFISKRKKIMAKRKDFYDNMDNPEYTDAMYQDLLNEIRNFNILYKRNVVLSDKEIDELLNYVRISIETLGFEKTNSFDWNLFIENCLSRLSEYYLSYYGEDSSEYINISKWTFFLNWSTLASESFFYAKVSYTTTYFRSNDEYIISNFKITDPSNATMYKISREGNIIKEEHVNTELLLAKNMSACLISRKDCQSKDLGFCLEIEKDNETILKNIVTEEYYTLDSSSNYDIEKISTMNDYFRLNNCGFLCRNLYSQDKLCGRWEHYSFPNNEYRIFMTYYNMSDKEKNSLERYIERIVIEWLIVLFQNKGNSVPEENIEVFKKYFTDYLRIKIIESIVYRKEFVVDLYSDNELVKLLVVSGIDGFYGFDPSTIIEGFHANFKGNSLPDKNEVSKVIRKIRKEQKNK